MKNAPAAGPTAPDLPFKYIGGDPSLDLVNTVEWTARGLVDERLTGYARLTRWAEGAGLVSARAAQRLRRQGVARPAEAEAAWEEAKALRSSLQRLYSEIAAGSASRRPGAALDEFNRLLARAVQQLRVVPLQGGHGRGEGRLAGWGWQDTEERLESVLWPVAWAAATLLTSDEAGKIRVCGSVDCGWMYVDRSRNGLRRWCQMETCGTREKSRRRAERGPMGQAG
jgi:predicted RNA-binding Zn ribbon-like protein